MEQSSIVRQATRPGRRAARSRATRSTPPECSTRCLSNPRCWAASSSARSLSQSFISETVTTGPSPAGECRVTTLTLATPSAPRSASPSPGADGRCGRRWWRYRTARCAGPPPARAGWSGRPFAARSQGRCVCRYGVPWPLLQGDSVSRPEPFGLPYGVYREPLGVPVATCVDGARKSLRLATLHRQAVWQKLTGLARSRRTRGYLGSSANGPLSVRICK